MLAELIRDEQPCVVLTGAGVSTESGIPDFRVARRDLGAVRPVRGRVDRGVPPRPGAGLGVLRRGGSTCSRDAQAERGAPARSRSSTRAGSSQAVITQNVDRLHERAGSRDVIEVHGSIATASCLACGARERCERVLELLPLPRVRRLRRGAQAGRRHVRRAAARGGDRPRESPSRRRPRCCSSSAPRSRCGRSRAFPRRRSATAGRSRS